MRGRNEKRNDESLPVKLGESAHESVEKAPKIYPLVSSMIMTVAPWSMMRPMNVEKLSPWICDENKKRHFDWYSHGSCELMNKICEMSMKAG